MNLTNRLARILLLTVAVALIGCGGETTPTGPTGGGSIIVTSQTADRIVGTFSFTAELYTGSGTPVTRTVTDGAFDLPVAE